MPTPSAEIIQLLATFATAMTAPTFANAQTLIWGTLLAPGRRRTVTAALRVLGLSDKGHNFSRYHRLLSRARWSPMLCSRLLLSLMVRLLVPADAATLVLLIDETLERRRGKKIGYKGWFRDAVRSTANRVSTSLGIRWCCVCVLVHLPWSPRPWALPFLLLPVLSEKTCQRLGKKKHRGTVGWAAFALERVRRWHPDRKVTLVGDGAYAAVELVATAQEQAVTLVSRMRLDARLYALPGPQPADKRGPKPKKGERQASLQERLCDPATSWRPVTLPWYGGQDKSLELATGTCLWHRPGQDPVPIRWVLARCPQGSLKPAAYLCSDPDVAAEQVLVWYVSRWNIEVTFEEMRAHLGFETQRQWSPAAICRTAPCLFGLFSLTVLMAHRLHSQQLPIPQASWYPKEEASFGDALAAVRAHLWNSWSYAQPSGRGDYVNSACPVEWCLIPKPLLERLHRAVCYAN